jgi:Kef-type K+ transport system membrane component KefB
MELSVLYYAGILIATGLLFGKIAKALRLPNVTGYLVGGLLVGPSILGILNMEGLHSLDVVSSVALGFIAFSIGNEMKISYFKRAGTRPIIIAVMEALMAVLFVLVAVLLFFLIQGQLTLVNIRFALVLSAIAAATAPAATIMVVRQYKAKGPLTETLLSVVAIDDSVAIVLFGLLVAISNALGNTTDASILMQLLKPFYEIIVSLLLGGISGILLVLGCRWFTGRGNRTSLVIALLFLLLFVVDIVEGSPLLSAMAMGFVFVNLSRHVDEVNNLTYAITPPIFILFFVLSGAELNLGILLQVGLIGLVYVLFRVAGKIFGAWWGSKITKADPVISKYLGFTLIPQAGVAIGLSLIATQVLSPEMGSSIRVIILSATLLYELFGPVVTKIALTKAGEIVTVPK